MQETLFIKVAGQFCEIIKNTIFHRTHLVAASNVSTYPILTILTNLAQQPKIFNP